jgi:hypothetical protein
MGTTGPTSTASTSNLTASTTTGLTYAGPMARAEPTPQASLASGAAQKDVPG